MEVDRRRLTQPRRLRRKSLRRAEEVDYWRKKAGWFDDDEAMMDYNDGVYDTFYQLDDDSKSGAHMEGGGSSGSGGVLTGAVSSVVVQNGIKALSVLVALGLCIFMIRLITRRFTEGKKDKRKKRSGSTGRSKSRSRSRSRSRRGDYDLMNDGEKSTRSKRTTRSKSRSGRSRSRSRARSRSKSRNRKEKSKQIISAATPSDPVLV